MKEREDRSGIPFTRRPDVRICVLLSLLTFAVFCGTMGNGFVDFDDGLYVAENSRVRAGLTLDGTAWAFSFSDKEKTYWHPLTWLSHMLDCQVYGLRPGMHHLTNLFLHMANTLLLFVVLRRMTGALWRSALVAALFALHPLGVESVAWVSERKNVLSTFFWMLTMLAYARYCESPGKSRYSLILLLFSLGLLAKPMIVTLPFVFLLLDYWPLGRLRIGGFGRVKDEDTGEISGAEEGRRGIFNLVLEKVPFFILSGISVFVSSMSLHRYGEVISTELVPMKLRVANYLVSYVAYAAKMVWPVNLAVFYPYPSTVPVWQAAGAGLLLACATLLTIIFARSKPFLATGWFWYLGALVPVSGLMQAGRWPAMADRWTYVPLIGLFIVVSWGIKEIVAQWHVKRGLVILFSAAVFSGLLACTWLQTTHWKDTLSLFSHALKATEENALAHYNLGVALGEEGRSDEAVVNYREAIRIKPGYMKAHNNLGAALADRGMVDEAETHYEAVLKLKPDHAEAHNSLGLVLAKKGSLGEAVEHYRKALSLRPEYADAHSNLGAVLATQGRWDEAVTHYRKAIGLSPDHAEAHNNLGAALAKGGRPEAAIDHYVKALRFRPEYAGAHNNLGLALAGQGRLDEAVKHYRDALRTRPEYAEAHSNLGVALARQGRARAAVRHLSEALRLNPDYVDAHYNLAVALAGQGRLDEAVPHYRETLRIRPEDAEAHNNLGVTLAKQGRISEAVGHFTEALRIRPDFSQARRNYEYGKKLMNSSGAE